MCSDVCNCEEAAAAVWAIQSDAELRTNYSRTINPTAEELSDYTTGDKINYQGIIPMTFTGTNQKFPDCEETIKAGIAASGNSVAQKAADFFFNKDGKSMLNDIETEFDCSGICYTPLFYFTRPATDGRATQTCDDAIIDKLSGNYAGAAVALLTAVMMLVSFIGSFPLCMGFNKEK